MIARALAAAVLAATLAAPAVAQDAPGDPTLRVPAADVQAAMVAMVRELKPGQTFLWHPVVKSGGNVAALELWTKAGKPAVHPAQDEYFTVMAGGGTLVTGGRMIDQVTTRADLLEGSRLEGANRRPLAVGDVVLVPAGTPHYFEVIGPRLVLLGTKLAVAAK